MSNSAYSNSGDQNSASNGHTSMQMPQYMHSEKSMANRSSTLRVRSRAARLRGRDDLLVRVDVDAPVRALAAHSMQTVQFSSSSAMTPRLRGGSSGSTSGYWLVTDRRVSALNVVASPCTSPVPAGGGCSALTQSPPGPRR